MEQKTLLPTTIKDVASCSGSSKTTPFRISIGRMLLLGLSVAPIALAYFLIITIVTDFDESTYTHCGAFNVIPSVSAVARSNQLGWIIVCWLSAPLMLLAAFLYMRLYRRILPRPVRSLSLGFTGSLVIHCFSTLCWAHFAHINGTHPFHVMTVTILWSSACIFMCGTFAIRKYFNNGSIGLMDLANEEQYSYLLKKKLAITFLFTFSLMWFWYLLHVEFCLPLVYSVFAIFEFVAFWSFLCYLCTAYFDFSNLYLCHDKRLGYFISEF